MAREEKTKPTRRIVKKAETVREQVEKRSIADAKPKNKGILGLAWYYATWPFRILGRGLKVIGRFIIPKYFKDSWKELRQVTWPSRRDTLKLTFAVIIFSAVFGLFVTAVDFVLDKLFRKVLI